MRTFAEISLVTRNNQRPAVIGSEGKGDGKRAVVREERVGEGGQGVRYLRMTFGQWL